MRWSKPLILPIITLICVVSQQVGNAEQSPELIKRLNQTHAENIGLIIQPAYSQAERPRGFSVANPYRSEAAAALQLWFQSPDQHHEVCAVQFIDAEKKRYKLQRFTSADEAAKAGFTVTHQGRCGSCSTLKDLSIYLSTPNLTTPARQCARKIGLNRKKQCFEERIGFTPYCSESWAYNAAHTRKECKSECIADYGFLNLIFHRYPGPNVLESGQLRPCLQCDEDISGEGFKYSAGRTRRNSGIKSAILRPPSAIIPIDHTAYFEQ